MKNIKKINWKQLKETTKTIIIASLIALPCGIYIGMQYQKSENSRIVEVVQNLSLKKQLKEFRKGSACKNRQPNRNQPKTQLRQIRHNPNLSKLRPIAKLQPELWRFQLSPRPKLASSQAKVGAKSFEIWLHNTAGTRQQCWQLCRPKAVAAPLRIIRGSTKTAPSTSAYSKLTAFTAFRKQNSLTPHATSPLLTKSGKSKATKRGVRSITKAT